MKTHSPGPGKRQMTMTVPTELDDEIKVLAFKSGLTRSKYCQAILGKAVEDKIIVGTETKLTFNSEKEPDNPTLPVEEKNSF